MLRFASRITRTECPHVLEVSFERLELDTTEGDSNAFRTLRFCLTRGQKEVSCPPRIVSGAVSEWWDTPAISLLVTLWHDKKAGDKSFMPKEYTLDLKQTISTAQFSLATFTVDAAQYAKDGGGVQAEGKKVQLVAPELKGLSGTATLHCRIRCYEAPHDTASVGSDSKAGDDSSVGLGSTRSAATPLGRSLPTPLHSSDLKDIATTSTPTSTTPGSTTAASIRTLLRINSSKEMGKDKDSKGNGPAYTSSNGVSSSCMLEDTKEERDQNQVWNGSSSTNNNSLTTATAETTPTAHASPEHKRRHTRKQTHHFDSATQLLNPAMSTPIPFDSPINLSGSGHGLNSSSGGDGGGGGKADRQISRSVSPSRHARSKSTFEGLLNGKVMEAGGADDGGHDGAEGEMSRDAAMRAKVAGMSGHRRGSTGTDGTVEGASLREKKVYEGRLNMIENQLEHSLKENAHLKAEVLSLQRKQRYMELEITQNNAAIEELEEYKAGRIQDDQLKEEEAVAERKHGGRLRAELVESVSLLEMCAQRMVGIENALAKWKRDLPPEAYRELKACVDVAFKDIA